MQKTFFGAKLGEHIREYFELIQKSYKDTISLKYDILNKEYICSIDLPMCRGGITLWAKQTELDPGEYLFTDKGTFNKKIEEAGIKDEKEQGAFNILKTQVKDQFKIDIAETDQISMTKFANPALIIAPFRDFMEKMINVEMSLEASRFAKMMKLDWPSSFFTAEDGTPISPESAF